MRYFVLSAFLLVAASARAQDPGAVADSACTYERCALRLEPGVLAPRLVRGPIDAAEVVGHVGVFGSDLSEAVAPSPEALVYAREYERYRTRSLAASLAFTAAYVVLFMPDDRVSDTVRAGAGVVGIGASIYGIVLVPKAGRSLARAVWEYNRSLVR